MLLSIECIHRNNTKALIYKNIFKEIAKKTDKNSKYNNNKTNKTNKTNKKERERRQCSSNTTEETPR